VANFDGNFEDQSFATFSDRVQKALTVYAVRMKIKH